MVAVILDYQVGVPTKQDESYMENIPRVLAALKTESMHWASTYNTTVVGTDLTDIVTGGHSAGGRSSFTHGLHNPSRALVLCDPIHVQSYSLPKDYRLDMPQLIMTTADSGCKYAINAMDNGVVSHQNFIFLCLCFSTLLSQHSRISMRRKVILS